MHSFTPENVHIILSSSVMLSIFILTAEPEFVVEPEIINLPQGETAVFSCEARGEPQPIITWTSNGDALDTHDTTVSINMKKI